jgi:hypothetical protein
LPPFANCSVSRSRFGGARTLNDCSSQAID